MVTSYNLITLNSCLYLNPHPLESLSLPRLAINSRLHNFLLSLNILNTLSSDHERGSLWRLGPTLPRVGVSECLLF